MLGRRPVMLWVLLGACTADAPSRSDLGSTSVFGTTGASSVGTTSDSETTSTGSANPVGSDATSGPADLGNDDTTGGAPPAPYLPAHYPNGRVHSPITAYVADRWHEYALRSQTPRDDVFMKAGASSTESPHTLFCFESNDSTDLGAFVHLDDALAYFRGGDAAGTSSFARTSLAAQTGRSAAWVVDGDPSPLDSEWTAVEPRWALLHYGTNDMNLGLTFGSAMVPFFSAMETAIDDLLERGTIPVVFGITRRGDNPAAQLWVETYNAVIRGLAQRRQIPFVDLFEAIDSLPDHGLSSDGIHLLPYPDGACVLTENGLQWGYNVRNLVALEALDRAMTVVVDDEAPLEPAPILSGDGTPNDPFAITEFPFAHGADTSMADTSSIDAYPPCDDADESGPELRYRVELTEPTPLRILVLDGPDVDVDVHVLEADGDGDACLARADRQVEGELAAGTWDIVVDTWSSGGDVFAGEYLLVVLPCGVGDEACAGALR